MKSILGGASIANLAHQLKENAKAIMLGVVLLVVVELLITGMAASAGLNGTTLLLIQFVPVGLAVALLFVAFNF